LETVTYAPVKALNNTLFPTLGLPTKATFLAVPLIGASVCLLQHVAIDFFLSLLLIFNFSKQRK
jgi:hypothetical protein